MHEPLLCRSGSSNTFLNGGGHKPYFLIFRQGFDGLLDGVVELSAGSILCQQLRQGQPRLAIPRFTPKIAAQQLQLSGAWLWKFALVHPGALSDAAAVLNC
jgi:hypothetical protein